jgi:acetoacetate decarboxylase
MMIDARWGLMPILLLLAVPAASAQETAAPGQAVDFSGTWLAPDETPYGTPPARYEGARITRMTFRTSPEVLRALVPPPLEPDGSGHMTVAFADFEVVGEIGGTYNEAYLSVPVKLGEQRGSYMPLLYLDNALAIIAGREVFGYNKVGAEVNIVEQGSAVRGTVIREGKTLIEMTVQLGDPIPPPPLVPASPTYNLKLIPPAAQGAAPDVKQLTALVRTGLEIKELRPGMGTLTLASLPTEPLGSIPVLEVVQVFFSVSDFVLPYGTVVHDYLAED